MLHNIKIKKLYPDSKIPTWTYETSAGADLYAHIDGPIAIAPHQTVSIPLGIATEFDPGYAALMYARSGTAMKHGIAPANKVGVIDSDYRGEWQFPAHNHSGVTKTIEPGERIGQVIFHKIEHPDFIVVDELSNTARGEGRYNSSGTK